MPIELSGIHFRAAPGSGTSEFIGGIFMLGYPENVFFNQTIMRIASDGEDGVHLISDPTEEEFDALLPTDGSKLFAGASPGSNIEMWTFDLDGSNPTILDSIAPNWGIASQINAHIYFSGNFKAIANVEQSAEWVDYTITSPPYNQSSSLSPVDLVVYTGSSEIISNSSDFQDEQRFGSYSGISISPDRTKICYLHDRWHVLVGDPTAWICTSHPDLTYPNEYRFYVSDINGGNLTELLTMADPVSSYLFAWNPDNSGQIIYQSITGISTINDDDTGASILHAGTTSIPVFSPDGTKISFKKSSDIYIMDSDGSNVINISEGEIANLYSLPEWSPDGSQIVVSAGSSGDEIWVIQISGPTQTKIFDGESFGYYFNNFKWIE